MTSDQRELVLVHQMGKVASSAIKVALATCPSIDAVHTHMLGRPELAAYLRRKRAEHAVIPEHARESLRLWRDAIRPGRDFSIISAVRSPIARNISAFFENLGPVPADPTDEFTDTLIARFIGGYRHAIPTTWFDRHVARPLGLDVFSAAFDHERGALELEHDGRRVLVLRAEDPDELRASRLSEYLRIDGVALSRHNVGTNKPYAPAYRRFLERFRAPGWMVEQLLESRTCRHFYTDQERASFAARWKDGTGAEAAA